MGLGIAAGAAATSAVGCCTANVARCAGLGVDCGRRSIGHVATSDVGISCEGLGCSRLASTSTSALHGQLLRNESSDASADGGGGETSADAVSVHASSGGNGNIGQGTGIGDGTMGQGRGAKGIGIGDGTSLSASEAAV